MSTLNRSILIDFLNDNASGDGTTDKLNLEIISFLIRKGDLSTAESELTKIDLKDSDECVVHRYFDCVLQLVDQLTKNQEDSKGVKLLEEATNRYKDFHQGLYKMAEIFFSTSRFDEAEKRLLKLKQINPQFLPGRMLLTNIYENKNDKSKFVNEMLDILEIEPHVKNYSRLERKIDDWSSEQEFENHPKIKIAFLNNHTLDPIPTMLKVKCLGKGILTENYLSGYNQYNQEILDPNSALYKFQPDVLIISLIGEDLFPKGSDVSFDESLQEKEDLITSVTTEVTNIINVLCQNTSATVLLTNFIAPKRSNFGILDNKNELGQFEIYRKINSKIATAFRENKQVYLVDMDSLANLFGKGICRNQKLWYMAKMPFHQDFMEMITNEYLCYIQALRGKSKKCLVLDLDNTLWGGIIGEDGFNGIKLGDTSPGNCFVDFQKEILRLYKKGVILALNSKNNPNDALEVLDKHPDMILRREHFACMKINWQIKAENMREIARELNIGIDSFVFMDDNPVERDFMRQQIPEVMTVEMPKDPALYKDTLLKIRDFEVLSMTDEDRKRGALYASQRARVDLEQSTGSLDDFLKSLEMKITIKKTDEFAIPRVSQLTQKTNQFNLTTKRYSEANIKEFVESDNHEVFYMRVEDKFGDNGIVGVCILNKSDATWDIDTFLMSCRVIGRKVETTFLYKLLNFARNNGAEVVTAWYIPTAKNVLVKDFYDNHDFTEVSKENGTTNWQIDITQKEFELSKWITVVES